MNRLLLSFALLTAFGLLAGCNSAPTGPGPRPVVPAPDNSELQGVVPTDGVITLAPHNADIDFVGSKLDKQHQGGFRAYSGRIDVDIEAKQVKKIEMTIITQSIWTDDGRLTHHLATADFFDSQNQPEAKFVSKEIVAGDGGKIDIVGDLTLLGKTNEIRFPAKVEFVENGLKLAAQLIINRFDFGMDYGKGEIHPEVTVNVTVGEAPAGAGAGPPAS